MLTQVALDLTSLSKAVEIAEASVEAGVHVLEVGTPLIKAEGSRAIERLAEEFPERPIVADTKTVDVGALEAELSIKHGANLGCVLGAAPKETIRSFVTRAHELGVGALVDTIGVNPVDVLPKLRGLEESPDYLLLHAAIDEPITGEELLRRFGVDRCPTRTAVAGGLTPEKIEELDGVDLVIVGGYITSSEDPAKAAEAVVEAAGVEPYDFRPDEDQREALLGIRRHGTVGLVVKDPERASEVLNAAIRLVEWVRNEPSLRTVGDDDSDLVPKFEDEGRDLTLVLGAEEFDREDLESIAKESVKTILVAEEHVLKLYGVAETVYEI
ncbi:orotidine 5'-phosphate decarboxylase / HUMPS family protein [Methanopyrus sp.]